MRTILSVLFSLIWLIGSAQTNIAQWRGPSRNGLYPETNLLTSWPAGGPKLLWKYEDIGKGYSSAAVTSDRVFTAGAIDSTLYVFALDHSGKLLWKSKMGPEWNRDFPGTRSTPVICGELGYMASAMGVLYCFETSTGRIRWARDLFRDFDGKNVRWGFTENMVLEGDKLFCTPGGKNANVIALNRLTGDVIWKSGANGEPSAYCSPVVIDHNGSKYFITMTTHHLIALDINTGTMIWKFPLEGEDHANTPLYRDGLLCAYDCASDGQGGIMLKISDDGKSVNEVWKNSRIRCSQGDGILIGNYLYRYNSHRKKLCCFDWLTGMEKYDLAMNAPILTLIAADGLLYGYSFNGEVVLIKPGEASFQETGRFTLPGNMKEHCAHPVIHDGRLYLRINNCLFVYSIGRNLSNS
jgi:outer membrane protein assembly factor BamB